MDPTELINFDRIDRLPLEEGTVFWGGSRVFNENIDIIRTLAVLRVGDISREKKKNIATGFDRILGIKVKLGRRGASLSGGIRDWPKVRLKFPFHLTEKAK